MKNLKKLFIVLIALFIGYMPFELNNTSLNDSSVPIRNTGDLTIHYLDVGQANCSVLQLPDNRVMIIDAGNNDDEYMIMDYLDKYSITTIDYLVGTHPHEDHIGSLDSLINNYEVKKLYMPDISADTKSYRDVIDAAKNAILPITHPDKNDYIYSDDDLKIQVLAPSRYYENVNNMSIVIRVTYKNSSFIFTGDAEEESEKSILSNVSSDVLLVGHHGSSTSTSHDFLERVDPMYAVISSGANNDYGHPHHETITLLDEEDITTYRTDLLGTIICNTSGNGPSDYHWTMEK